MINKISALITKNLVIVVILFVVIGYCCPSLLVKLKPYNEWLFALTMLGIGFVLNFADFVYIFKKFYIVLLGTLAQFLIMPLGGFLVGNLFPFSAGLKLGFVMTGSVPGAMASNVISYLAKADVAYSISLTTMSTFLSPLLTPLFVYIFASSIIKVNFLHMCVSIIRMVIVPVIIGLAVRSFAKEKIKGAIEIFPAFSTIFIGFICGLVVALNRDYLMKMTPLVFLGALILNFWGLLLGYLAGKVYRLNILRVRTLSIEVGMQNAGLGAVLSLKYFSSESTLPSAIFATLCIITASILAKIWSRGSEFVCNS
jgi:BASS family bile acid:Na+ symporter